MSLSAEGLSALGPLAPAAPATPPAPTGSKLPVTPADRLPGLDIARGLAVVLMLQTHAFDGWVSSAQKASLGYAISRALANVPAPLFLLLAGVGLSFGAHAAARRGLADGQIRRQLMRRGLGVLGYGYLVSALYLAIEWPVPRADLAPLLLRVDILHCIGLSLVLCAALLVRRAQLAWRVSVAIALGLALSLSAGRLGALAIPSWLAPGLGLFVDVPRYTRFPLLPLFGFCAVGVWVGERLLHRAIGPRLHLRWFAAALVAILCFGLATRVTLQALGGALRRTHPAVVWNFGDGAARALATLYVGLGLPRWLAVDGWLLRGLTRLGAGSLVAYALHIPFCYGRLARPLAARLSMATALACLLGLLFAVYGALVLRDALRPYIQRLARRGPHSP